MIQLYASKNNFDAQKVQRFLKERKIPFQLMDLKKHKPGGRELDLFIKAAGSAKKLVDRTDKKVLSHPIAHFDTDSLVREALLENPLFLISPITRNGTRVMLGFDKEALEALIAGEGRN